MILLLLTHIFLALCSVAWATVTAFRPSYKKVYVSYAMIGATLSSGTVLVVLSSQSIVTACITGLVYVVGMTAATIVAHVRIKANVIAPERADQE